MIYEKFYYSLNLNFTNELDEAKLFIESLECNLKKFISLSTKSNDNFNNNQFVKQSKIRYTPEKWTLSSPLTLFEGPKFSGKTTFMESICKSILDNKIKLSYINKIKIINLLNFFPCSKSEDSFNLFINDILNVLDNSEIKKSLCKYLSTFLEKNDTDKLNNNLDLIRKINKQINKPFLFIIDNIEKIDSNLEDVLQIINKLSVINNFAFLFIVNGSFNKLTTYYSDEKEKSTSKSYKKLESFVNLPIYKFNQDYTCLLNKYDLNSKLVNELNDILVNDNDYLISIKELDAFLTTITENDGHLNKYKLLAHLYNTFPRAKDKISNIIEDCKWLFLDNLDSLKELIDRKLLISEKTLNELRQLEGSIIIDNNCYWENSEIQHNLKEQFNNIFLDSSYDDNRTKYENILLDINKKIDIEILSINEENKSIQKQISDSKVLKSKKNKINDEQLYSIVSSNVDETNYEITSLENLFDHLTISDPEEINKIKNKVIENGVILKNLNFIKKFLNAYFDKLKDVAIDIPNKIKKLFDNKDYQDDINVLNKIFLDTKFKYELLERSDSYKKLLEFRSLRETMDDTNSKIFKELIDFISSEMPNYIMNNYNELN